MSDGARPGISYLASSPVPSNAANSVNVVGMCSGFAKAGFDVSVYSPVSSVLGKQAADFERDYGLDGTLHLEQVFCPRYRGGLWLYRRILERKLRRDGKEYVYGRNLWGCESASRLGIPTALEAHMPVWQRGRASRDAFEAMIGRNAFRGLVVISNALAREFSKAYPRLEGKIAVEHDAASSCPWPDFPVNAGGRRLQVVYAGSLYSGKGMEILADVARKCPWADFTIVGGQTEEVSRWRAAIGAGNGNNMQFVGHVPHGKVRDYVLAADVVVAPYMSSVMAAGEKNDVAKWMSPLKIFEYMAANRPIVASDLPVLREVLIDRTNALLVSPDSADSWARALRELRDNPGLAVEVARHAREDFETYYTWEARALRVARFLGWKPEVGAAVA